MRSKLTFWGCLSLVALLVCACEMNLYSFVADDDDPDALLEGVRAALDERDYATARAKINALKGAGNDSTDVRLLEVATDLGESGLDMWEILVSVLETATGLGLATATTANDGVSQFFDSITGSVLGTGDTRTQRMDALRNSLRRLFDAPEPKDSRIKGMSCLLAGVLAVPLFSDMQGAITSAADSLTQIGSTVAAGGDPCEDLGEFESSVSSAADNANDFALVLEAATSGCAFLDVSKTSGLNTVETQVKKLTTSADQGCSALPECPASNPNCNEIFPECVQDAMGIGSTSSNSSGDGRISGCELILFCRTAGNCF